MDTMRQREPLDSPALREIERLLEARDLDEAQRLLASIESGQDADATAYLAAKLLFYRGKLDKPGLIARIREILTRIGYFPEAAMTLHAAEHDKLADTVTATGSFAGAAPPEEAAAAWPFEPERKTDPLGSAPIAPMRASPTMQGPGSPPGSPFALPDEHPRRETPPWHPASDRPPPFVSGAPTEDEDEFDAPFPAQPRTEGKRSFTPLRGFPVLPREQGADEAVGQSARSAAPAHETLGQSARSAAPAHEAVGQSARSAAPAHETLGQSARSAAPAHETLGIPRPPAVPEFESNRRPPSYEPDAQEASEFDQLRQKQKLPPNAGRYSQKPLETDRVGSGRRVTGGLPGSSASRPAGQRQSAPANPARSSAASHAPASSDAPIQSGLPAASVGPSLFEVATWIDEGRYGQAVTALSELGPTLSPDYALLMARALAGAGHTDQAFELITQLEGAPLLEPELRAAAARLLIELGEPERALRQAIEALDADPERQLIRLTYALAAVRCNRRRRNDTLLEKADRALRSLRHPGGPHPALAQGLRAAILSASGESDQALAIAQDALRLDPTSIDALSAIVEARARAGQVDEARKVWTRLKHLDPDEAGALVRLLPDLAQAETIPLGASELMWTPAEEALLRGDRVAATQAVEKVASDYVRRMTKSGSQSGLTAIATVASGCLTVAPVFERFAPYDLSLWSILRVDAAIDLVYGPGRLPTLNSDAAPIVLLLGAYVGETLRRAHDGHWEGRADDLDQARVAAGTRNWRPFRAVWRRLEQGASASLIEALSGAFAKRGSASWQSLVPNPASPSVPWGPGAWPRANDLPRIGRAVSRSAISLYCERFAEGSLDRSMASLVSIDTYLNLVAPDEASLESESSWARATAVLVGAYIGEVLREHVGGEWIVSSDGADAAADFRVVLRGRTEAAPIAWVLERLLDRRHAKVTDFGETIVRRALRP